MFGKRYLNFIGKYKMNSELDHNIWCIKVFISDKFNWLHALPGYQIPWIDVKI